MAAVNSKIINGTSPVAYTQAAVGDIAITNDNTFWILVSSDTSNAANWKKLDIDSTDDDAIPRVYPYNDGVLHITTHNGIGSQLRLHGGLLRLRVTAFDFIKDIQNSTGTITYGIRKAGAGTGFPATQGTNPKELFLTFDCNELAQQYVEIWAKDSNTTPGEEPYSNTFVIVEDNYGAC